MTRDSDNIRDDITELKISSARQEEKHDALEHRVRNQSQRTDALERRFLRMEGQVTWLLRIAMAAMTSLIGAGYAAMRKAGFV